MAKALNQNRIRDTRVLLLLALLVTMFTAPDFAPNGLGHTLLEMVGELLVAACAVGRVFTTAFLGGHKNARLIAHGPFSVVRNPLYVCSLLGVTGVALMSAHWLVMLVLPAAFLGLYAALVAREEVRLHEIFGADYAEYCAGTPRFLPRFAQYQAATSMEVNPALLWNAVRDASLWFLALPMFELITHAQLAGLLPAWRFF